MVLPLKESNAARALAECLHTFLPGGGAQMWKGHVNFGSVAERVGVGEFWPAAGTKAPRLARLFEETLLRRRERFEPLIRAIVSEGLQYRKRSGTPITRQEIEKANGHIAEIGFRFSDLWDEDFLAALSMDDASRAREKVAEVRREREALTTVADHVRSRPDDESSRSRSSAVT